MNLVDSCGWLEYFANDSNAAFYAPALNDPDKVVVPSICIYEVFKRLVQSSGRSAGLQAVAAMQQGHVIGLDDGIALDAATLGLEWRLPLADSVILATAKSADAVIWTQDAHFQHIPGVRYIEK